MSIGNFSGRGWDGSITDENHIAEALEKLGHSVTRVQREGQLEFTPHPSTPFDFVLIAQWDGYPADTIEMLRRNYKINWSNGQTDKPPKIVYWAFDYQADGQEWHEKLVAEADLYLSKRLADSKYPNWRWLSQDFAPDFLDKSPPVIKDIDVLFTGSYLPWAEERNKLLKIVDDHFPLVIHSVNAWDGFKDVRPPIMDEGLPELYARAKLVLSIDHTIEAGYWSDRNAQVMCCGGLVLFRYVEESEQTFGNNVAYFETSFGMLNAIRYYLDTPMAVKLQSEAGYRYAQDNLKATNRVEDLITIVRSVL